MTDRRQNRHNGTPMRWLAVLIGTSALAMTLVVVLGLIVRESEPVATATNTGGDPLEPLVVLAPGFGRDTSAPIGGPEESEPAQESNDTPAEDLGVAPEIVVDGGPGVFAWPLGGTFEQSMTVWHPGIDIGASYGAPLGATRAGTVTFVGGDPCCSYGSYILVQHTDAWSSRYAHLSSFAVSVGDSVVQGQLLGTVGLTGRTSGPHLHFELLYYGVPVDPLDYLSGGATIRSDALAAGLDAPPPPPDYVEDEPLEQPQAPAAPESPPATPEPVASSTAVMVSAAASWMSASGEYIVGSCGGGPAALNQWLITCEAERTGCDDGAACVETKLICVIDDPLTIWYC